MEYKDFTNVEVATIVAHSITFNCEKAQRMFQEENDKEPLPARTLGHWKDRFMETLPLSLHPRSHAGDQSNRRVSDEKKDEVLAAFADEPTTSQRNVAQQCQVNRQRESHLERRLPPSLKVQVCARTPTRRFC